MDKAAVVYVVDDDLDSRESASVLVMQMGFRVKSFPSAKDFLACCDGCRPACLLTDFRMPGMNGIELVDTLRAEGNSLATIIMTAFAETELTVRAIRGGAVNLIEKPFSYQTLWQSIQKALAEDRTQYVNELKLRKIRTRLDSLTDAELAVVRRIVQGHSNKAVSLELDVSIRTIESRRSKILNKMQVKSVAELVQLAMIARPEICLADTELDVLRITP